MATKAVTTAEAAFAMNLRTARSAKGLTQAELADAMVVAGFRWHPTTVYKVENGERQIQLGEALALGRLLGLAVEDMSTPDDDGVRQQAAVEDSYRLLGDAAARLLADVEDYQARGAALAEALAAVEDPGAAFASDVLKRLRKLTAATTDLNVAVKRVQKTLPAMWPSITRSPSAMLTVGLSNMGVGKVPTLRDVVVEVESAAPRRRGGKR